MSDTTVHCLVQNRLGALDRVLLALTHRGIVPNQFSCLKDECGDWLQVTVQFMANDVTAVEKLIKFLQKQVYVLDARAVECGASVQRHKVKELFKSEAHQRRVFHAHNA